MTVGLVVVTYDSAALARRLVESIAAQTRRPDRLIVVDNASRDGTADAMRQALAATTLPAEFVALDRNTGFAAANNLAVARLDGCDAVVLLNPDAFPEPAWLARLEAAALRHPDAASLASRLMRDGQPGVLDGAGDVVHASGIVWRHGHGRPLADVPDALVEREVFAACAAAAWYRRDAWVAAGGFDERFFCFVEDVDLGFRLRLAGATCWYVPDAVVSHVGSAVTGVDSPFAIYHGHRNLTWMFAKDMPASLLWRWLPAHVGAALVGVPWFARRGRLGPYLRAKRDALAGLPAMWRSRDAVRRASPEARAAIARLVDRRSLATRARERSQGAAGVSTTASLLDRAAFQLAWRLKPLARAVVPGAARQRIATTLLTRAYRPEARRTAPSTSFTSRPRGLNVLGYLRAESGVAEAARTTLRACRAAGVPASAIDYARQAPSRLGEVAPDGWPSTAEYGVTLVHLNADQCAFAVVDHADALDGRYRIGCWNWELPEFPDRWPEAEQSLDEVWAPSRFCAEAFSRRLKLPVTHMPYAVDVPVPAGLDRPALGLPADPFVFLFVFDAFSVPARKNPEAVIEAFARVRAATSTPVHLVLKVINAASQPSLARTLADARARPGITVIDRYLDRRELNALLHACDAYVSLHRSEGFGFTMAEAMALGKPVVATGWSGNMDFMSDAAACPVRYQLVPLAESYGPYAAGQTWADPDVTHAAELMTRLATDRAWAAGVGARAAAHMRAQFAPQVVGRRIGDRLDAIYAAAASR
ncbi:MAG: glycosyltransferase [Vicinamibacterales bacterium]